MRRRNTTSFFKDKFVAIGAASVLLLTLAVVGISSLTAGKTQEEKKNLVDLNEVPDNIEMAKDDQENEDSKVNVSNGENIIADNYDDKTFGMDNVMDATDEYIPEGDELYLPEDIELSKADNITADDEDIAKEEPAEETQAASAGADAVVSNSVSFSTDAKMMWPVSGNVLLNYSMDSTIYFATLNQYKYNPALVIQGDVNTKVLSASDAIIEDIYTDTETGITIKADLGNGYKALYGQLKETTVNIGDKVDKGAILGYISEPTKYYSIEGSNLYFEITKDSIPVNPLSFLE